MTLLDPAEPTDGWTHPPPYDHEIWCLSCVREVRTCPKCKSKNIEVSDMVEGHLSFWHERPLDEDWTVAYRLVVQGDRTVIGEVRVFPREADRTELGEWSGSRMGYASQVPTGGLTSTVLRGVRTSNHILEALDIATQWDVDGPRHRTEIEGGGYSFAILDPSTPLVEDSGEERRGRPRTPLVELARIAHRYVELSQTGSKAPRKALAEECFVSVHTIDKQLRAARDRGLLTKQPTGRGGGNLTQRARQLLADDGNTI